MLLLGGSEDEEEEEAARESWMPAMETAEAPACQRMDFPGVYSPMRYMAWVAVIQVCCGGGGEEVT